MNNTGNVIRKILKFTVYTVFIIVILFLIPYLFCPVYDFKESTAFKGDELYNPYKDIKSGNWYKANFHAHSRIYFGVTAGSLSPADSIIALYRKIGYDIPGISDYMSINATAENSEGYLPVYEHGFGIWKNHYLVIGAKETSPIDFIFYQTNNHQQFVLNRVKKDDNIIAIVHPGLRYAVTKEDLVTLNNYDCLEIFRHDREYLGHLDYALSNGKDIKILANDDCHNIVECQEVGNSLNLINSKSLNNKDILESIKNGSNIGVSLKDCGISTFELKTETIHALPKLLNFEVQNDTVKLRLDSKAAEIKFTGQNGIVRETVKDTKEASYNFKPEDTYIRTEIIFPNNTKYELNPVYRYDKNNNNKPNSVINIPKSAAYYFLWLTVAAGVIYFKRRRKNKL